MIPVDILINCILVNERIRPAMLVQPIDYREEKGSDPRTKTIVDEIRRRFPRLQCSEDYKGIYQGVIISLSSFNDETIGLNDMGKILGYPCYSDFETLDRDVDHYSMTLVARTKNDKRYHIFANICRDESRIYEFQRMAYGAMKVLRNPAYADMFTSRIRDVYVEVKLITPIADLLKLVVSGKALSSKDMEKILNYLYNLGYEEEWISELEGSIQYDNPFHRGFLASFIIESKYNLISPFYPLKGQLLRHSAIVNQRREKMILEVINSTRDGFHVDKKEQFKRGLLYSIDYIDSDEKNCILTPFRSIMDKNETIKKRVEAIQEAKTKKINSILKGIMRGGGNTKKQKQNTKNKTQKTKHKKQNTKKI